MDFDHITGDKDRSVIEMAFAAVSVEKLQAEIDKCEIVCSNCHRNRTHMRRQSLVV